MALSYIHDLYMLSAIPDAWVSPSVKRKIDSVLGYVLADAFQRLPGAYGYLRDESKGPARYYVLGWRPDLSGFDCMPPAGGGQATFVMRMELMARFALARKHRWFQEGMMHLETFKTAGSAYCLPRPYLQEKRTGYWVSGSHMGLEQPRRPTNTWAVESTFRVFRLKRLAGQD